MKTVKIERENRKFLFDRVFGSELDTLSFNRNWSEEKYVYDLKCIQRDWWMWSLEQKLYSILKIYSCVHKIILILRKYVNTMTSKHFFVFLSSFTRVQPITSLLKRYPGKFFEHIWILFTCLIKNMRNKHLGIWIKNSKLLVWAKKSLFSKFASKLNEILIFTLDWNRKVYETSYGNFFG